ncbi:Uncharacterized conserved protein, DUF1800 family [Mucilaginibacter mallensis]|uniref:Uncharacterized conserved protein, DUF1800 family n=1 Tax=Mucilaginibacter mallensis TaxID=652787 RepID=A0A1H1N0T8_MUCMA|nr:DUF1800 domain-containing protein [Mucilaginibacter mallensis]SDR92537.1 Uncharacterized conserved protein, DUF1800 family [Mucilaginibacter mallensis]
MDNIKPIKHLFTRAAFGMRFEDVSDDEHLTAKATVKQLFKTSDNSDSIDIIKDSTDYTMLMKGDIGAKKIFLQEQRQQEKDLNLAWIDKMSKTDAQLREKMTLFWHNHFACRSNRASFAQQLNNIQRSNALGNFRTMVMEVSKSPAMLQFLNNQQNQKGHPNENFARELMELFTIGRGNYTEHDVKESARAFTGWGFNKDGEFKMRPFVHDDGQKTFMGKTGNFQGEDIINTLLERKETAYFISNKLYKYLVNETPDPAHVSAMADVFYNANYEIKTLLEYIFTADWFYDDKNTGNLVKSPVEFLTGLNRQFYITYQKPEVLLLFERALGQVLFYPPNVAGWPGGRNWIDSSSLMYRIKIPSTLLNGGIIDFTGKADPEDEAYIATLHNQQQAVATKVQAQPDWDRFLNSIPKDTSKMAIAQFMLAPKLNNTLIDTVTQATDIKQMVIELVSTPEYQLC